MINGATLTIGIPTYNGSAYIRSTLDSVIKQIPDDLKQRVDILVSDNASTDEIPEIVKAYQNSQSVRIQYSRNDTNVGYDRNVDMLFKKASGQYVWMLGDDDVLKDEAISQVLNILDLHHNLKVVQINFDCYDRKFENLLTPASKSVDLLCNDADSFLLHSNGRYGQVSSLVINKEAWNREDLTKGQGSNFIHVYALFRILLRGNSYIINRPLINIRMGSENFGTSGDSLLSIALSTGAIFNSLKELGYSSNMVKLLIKPARRYAYDTILIAKLAGLKNKRWAVKKLVGVYNGPLLWFKWIPVILCPDSIFKKLYFLKKGVSSKTRIIERKLKEWIRTPQ